MSRTDANVIGSWSAAIEALVCLLTQSTCVRVLADTTPTGITVVPMAMHTGQLLTAKSGIERFTGTDVTDGVESAEVLTGQNRLAEFTCRP